MQDLTICPSCRLWQESLRVMPCCQFKFCDDCVWKTGGCKRCNNRLDFQLLRIYKPIDALIRECLAPCKHCGELHTPFMLKSHESNCPKTPVSDLVLDLTDSLSSLEGKTGLTEQDLREFYVRKNLLSSFQQTLDRHSSAASVDGFINHVISDTDTLSGIALRYGVTMNDIRKANGLVGNGDHAIFQRLVLRIPAKAQQVQEQGEIDLAAYNLLKRRTIARFARKSGCNNLDEAQYYLETHHFDYELAMSEYQKDAKVALPIPPKTISMHVPNTPTVSTKTRSCCFFMA